MSASMGHLPEEIQAFILSKLDGTTAAAARQVCRLWHGLISGLERSFHFWLRHCLREMSPYNLVEITRIMPLAKLRESTYCRDLLEWESNLCDVLPWMFWQQVYAEFSRFRYIQTGHEKQTELFFFPLYGEVTCLYMQDNVIYSGHESGCVMSWKNISEDLNGDILYRHQRKVTSLAAINMVANTEELLTDHPGQILLSSSRDTTLMMYNLKTERSKEIKYYSKQVNSVRSWGNHFVAAAYGSMLQGQPIWRISDKSDLSTEVKCQLFGQTVSNMTTVAFWDNNVISGDDLGNLFCWSCISEDTDIIGCKKTEDMVPLVNLHSPIKSLHLLGNKRILCLTDDGRLHLSHDGSSFQSWLVYDCIQMIPERLAVRGPVVAIGVCSGCVYLYLVPTEKDWMTLDLNKPSHIVRTGKNHVNDIVIGDDEGGPVIVIATEGNCLTVVQWRKAIIECLKDSTVNSNIGSSKLKALPSMEGKALENRNILSPYLSEDEDDYCEDEILDHSFMLDDFVDGIEQERNLRIHVDHKKTMRMLLHSEDERNISNEETKGGQLWLPESDDEVSVLHKSQSDLIKPGLDKRQLITKETKELGSPVSSLGEENPPSSVPSDSSTGEDSGVSMRLQSTEEEEKNHSIPVSSESDEHEQSLKCQQDGRLPVLSSQDEQVSSETEAVCVQIADVKLSVTKEMDDRFINTIEETGEDEETIMSRNIVLS